ncbi:DNA-binding NtrC family response regulator [Sphingopyxis sp. OAS728]|uniref:response regulator n=1 Tax=Sphingopyxis sp. OAS728 TaxID=2663823 RepID=UPI00178C0EB8|nr:response regulator [Sphingopyxis sp. OAS728]MBE1529487.1 DNA-binding NtrC family response regulator [Sphingopyxis sp. OAS728]
MSSRVLIVEDDPVLALMLEEYLELLGHEPVGSADCVASALAILSDRKIDAAIIDIVLADGETSDPVADALAAANIPFLVATGGFIEPPAPVYARCPVLMKPYTIKGLNAALAALPGPQSQKIASGG